DTSSSTSPSHTYKKAGVYQIKLIINGDCGKDSISKSIEVNLTGIEQYSELLKQVKVYPQPAAISMLIESVIEIYQLRILDLSGKQVLINTSSFTTKEIDVENLENGIYILELKAGDTISRRKIEILR
ncbi:MAG: T9SS type A sorting domain-containing protein, partial [Flavobacteriales bacterium]